MQKEIYVVKGLRSEDYTIFRKRMFDLVTVISDRIKPVTLKITLTEETPPRMSVIPYRKEKVAVFSLTQPTHTDPDFIINEDGFVGGYDVDEAVPVAYEKTWENKTPTPGVCLLTLFHRKPGIDQETFIRRWHEGHTPLSLRLHPLWNYNRNVVRDRLTETTFWYDGIVEEQFKNRSELMNPFRFFGPAWKVPYHMYLVYKDSNSFIDMKRIETYLATEYHIVDQD